MNRNRDVVAGFFILAFDDILNSIKEDIDKFIRDKKNEYKYLINDTIKGLTNVLQNIALDPLNPFNYIQFCNYVYNFNSHIDTIIIEPYFNNLPHELEVEILRRDALLLDKIYSILVFVDEFLSPQSKKDDLNELINFAQIEYLINTFINEISVLFDNE